jgi:hypothetical protein
LGAFFFGVAEKKPGYSLQSFFAARRQKKDFRFYPSRGRIREPLTPLTNDKTECRCGPQQAADLPV